MIVRAGLERPSVPFTPAEKLRLIAEISTTYARVRWLLRRRSVQQIADAARGGQRPLPAGDVPKEQLWLALRFGRAVERNLERLPGDTRCLTRSLVLLTILARRGVASTLIIGVRPSPNFGAHAWVELGGTALLSPIEFGGGRLADI